MYLITIGYQTFVTYDQDLAFRCLNNLNPVSRSYVDNQEVYEPEEKKVSVTVIDNKIVRKLTKEEEENQKIKSLEDRNKWVSDERDRLKKETEELRCQLKVALTKVDE